MPTAYIAQPILLEKTLSDLSLGFTEPMLAQELILSGETPDDFLRAPRLGIFSGIAILLAGVVFNLLDDAIDDFLNSRVSK